MYGHIVIACLFGVALAAPSGGYLGPIAYGIDSVSVPHYNFNYAVNDPHTGDSKSQHEMREGGVVKGSYSVAEPDGTLRIVDYKADPISGFNAVVKRVGAAAHPQTLVAPVYTKEIIAPVAHVAPISSINVGYWGLGHGNLGIGGLGHGSLGIGGLGHAGLSYGGLGHGSLGYDLGLGLGHGYGLESLGYGGLWKH